MKNVIFCDLYNTLLGIEYYKLGISPLLKERLLTKSDFIAPSYLKRIFERQVESVYLFDDTVEFLEKARKTHRLVCISNLSADFVRCFYDFELNTFLEPLFSCEVGSYKPQPLIYNKILNSLDVKQKIFMIGDSYINDYKRPRELGIKSFLLNRDDKKHKIDKEHEVNNLLSFYDKIMK